MKERGFGAMDGPTRRAMLALASLAVLCSGPAEPHRPGADQP